MDTAIQMTIFDLPLIGKPEPKKITEEFGEHIGGARKELWRARGLSLDDLSYMNAAERQKYVKKDAVWKKPDYLEMINGGMDKGIVFIIKKIRDACPSAPNISRLDDSDEAKSLRCSEYVEFVSAIRDKAMSVKTNADALSLKTFFKDNDYIDMAASSSYRLTPSEKSHGLLTDKLFQAFNLTEYTLRRYSYEMNRTGFGLPAEEKLPAGYQIRFCNTENKLYKKDTYYVVKKCSVVAKDFVTKAEAFAFAKEHAKKKNGKKAFVPPQLTHIRREGLKDVRAGRDITGQDFLDDFSIKGGEFGEWMSEKDAQGSLNMAYEAFHDMAMILGISPSRISLGGELSIAFGARGHGRAVACV